MAEPQEILVTALRSGLTDPNPNRVGTNYIFPDLPRIRDLKKNSFPRIGVEPLSETAETIGTTGEDMVNTVVLRVQIWTVKGLVCSIDASSYEGQALVDKMARDMKSWLRQNWRTDANLKDKWFSYEITGDRQLSFDEESSMPKFGREIEIMVTSINVGE
jgi:hypothetical protein